MLPRARLDTTSSAFVTNKVPSPDASGEGTLVQFVKGVGPGLSSVFASRGITTVRDLLTFFPRAYEDRTRLSKIEEAPSGGSVTMALEVLGSRKIPTRHGKTMLEVRCTDGKSSLVLKWFHSPRGLENRFIVGTKVVATGTLKSYLGRPEIVHPEITFTGQPTLAKPSANESADYGRIVPIYVEIEGVPTRTLRKVLYAAIERYVPALKEDLPPAALAKHGLPTLQEAIREIHFPSEGKTNVEALQAFRSPCQLRFIYEEFFKFEFLVLLKRLRMEKLQAHRFGSHGGSAALLELEGGLPFKLTGDQKKAVSEITVDLESQHPMNRLIQGDVGSGKTAVAFLTAGLVIAEGGQVALMAPTEILAEQHYRNALLLFGTKVRVALLTGRTTAQARNELFGRMAAGEPLLVIGTHALIEDPVPFTHLAYVLIDEQHRFGVDQRRKLRAKGVRQTNAGREYPHVLVLTATPIPRTLALTAYGDLSVSTIREMPPGRTPIKTRLIRGDSERAKAYAFVKQQLLAGRQAYFIYPLVNESEAEGFTHLASAVKEAERLGREVFPEFKVGLLHGQLRPDEKAEIMSRFVRGDLQVLVSTTVIEVGVDVANSTVICIEHAERFGLSQLHQLRGRVGRGSHESFCFLFSTEKTGENTRNRLEILEETTDGFKIAEADLAIRGPGEFLGVRQAGALPFRMADLVRDLEWLNRAREDAEALLREDPALTEPRNQALREYFDREGNTQGERLTTS